MYRVDGDRSGEFHRELARHASDNAEPVIKDLMMIRLDSLEVTRPLTLA